MTKFGTSLAGFLVLLVAPAVLAQTPDIELRARRAPAPPKLDGVLNDAAWAAPPHAKGGWVSYNPLRGEPAPQDTEVWIAYDDAALYFAFRCYDEDPGRIRTTISRRDNVWNDDWVAVSLDSSRAGQVAYHMFVNPSGIQMDSLNSGDNGEDQAVDWVWQSAGRVDEQGYTIEVRVPLESIRFRGGSDVRMGVMFFRRNSRSGISWAWPELQPGEWVFQRHVPLVFDELHQRRVFEVLPSATVSRNQSRNEARAWNGARADGDVGVSLKYGLTSTTTLDATINPDFSQVESDAFEVEVNQRFPVFFSEKRPFFMEGLGLFNLAGTGGDATLRSAVHTRKIVEPSAGLKLTGTAGRYTFAALSSGDRSASPDRQRLFTMGRGVRNFGNGRYVGALVTDTEFSREHNRVIGGDIVMRHGDRFRWNGSLLFSDSRPLLGGSRTGVGSQLSYSYNTRRITIAGQAEHYDRGFQMDTAFINRVGLTRGWQYLEVQFYPDEARYPWLKRIAPFIWIAGAEDRTQGGTELFVQPALRVNFTRQGFVRLDYARGHETFVGQRFETGRMKAEGSAQFTNWLNLGGFIEQAPAVFYDPLAPFQGTRTATNLRVGVQPSAKLNHNLTYNFVTFEDQRTRTETFRLHIVNLRNTYQFTPQFLVRAIAQLDTSRRRVLGDFLASYELAPGTVVHAGYGTLLERLLEEPYRPVARAFFFKASYLARF